MSRRYSLTFQAEIVGCVLSVAALLPVDQFERFKGFCVVIVCPPCVKFFIFFLSLLRVKVNNCGQLLRVIGIPPPPAPLQLVFFL